MRHVTLTAQRDGETGELGLKIDGVPSIDYPMVATEGLLIAHDLIEHQQGLRKIGTIGDELIALGGIWYTRGRWSDISRDGGGSMHAPEVHIASDVTHMGRQYVTGYNYGSRLHAKIPKRAPECDAAEVFRDVLRYALRDLREELRGEDYDRRRLALYLRYAYRLMCKGYNMARRRFEGKLKASHYYANVIFWEIAEAVEPYARHCEYEGQRFRLSYGNGEARCSEIFEEDYY